MAKNIDEGRKGATLSSILNLVAILFFLIYFFFIYNLVPETSNENMNRDFDHGSGPFTTDKKGNIYPKFGHEAMPIISYEKVEEKRDDYVRYAAFLKESSSSSSGNNNEPKIPLSVLKWAEIMSQNVETQSNNNFAMQLSNIMKNVDYEAFFFETKGVSSTSASTKQFEFVLVNAPELKQFCTREGPDVTSFSDHLSIPVSNTPINAFLTTDRLKFCNKYGCIFPNLSGDTQLVVPKWNYQDEAKDNQSKTSASSYSHLAVFLREAPTIQISNLWQMVATQYKQFITIDEKKAEVNKAVWLSTSGTGVSYLHFRLCHRPKYYTFTEFAQEK